MNDNTATPIQRPWEKRSTDPDIRETAERIREEWARDWNVYWLGRHVTRDFATENTRRLTGKDVI